MNWEAWIAQQHPEVLDLSGMVSSSALVAALVRIQIARGQALQLQQPPAGLYGLARVLGVDERFIWE